MVAQEVVVLLVRVQIPIDTPEHKRILAHAASATCHVSERDAQEMSAVFLYINSF